VFRIQNRIRIRLADPDPEDVRKGKMMGENPKTATGNYTLKSI
jgi:hypothetical protein